MDNQVSKYLEFLRVFATLGVMLSHSFNPRFNELLYIGTGHLFVIVFFVLSGYVISYVVESKDKSFYDFTLSRLTRFLTVLLPALILVPLLDFVGKRANEIVYSGTVHDNHFLMRFLVNLGFLQEIWFNSIRYLSNGPMWSLGYEFWYYFLFASVFYYSGRKRNLLLLSLTLLVGPKILLLFPIWLMGSCIYKLHKTDFNLGKYSLSFFLGSLGLMYVSVMLHDRLGFDSFEKKMHSLNLMFSSGFAFDLWFGLLISLNIFSVKYIVNNQFTKILDMFFSLTAPLSSSSFTIYIMHYPVMLFLFSTLNLSRNSLSDWAIMFILTLLMCFILAKFTEQKRHTLKNLSLKFKTWINYQAKS